MKLFVKKYFAFMLIVVGSLAFFAGCFGSPYKDLKLSLSESEINIVLSDDPTENVFSVEASVSGRPKGYNGAVNFSVSSLTNSIVMLPGGQLSGGATSATFRANYPGSSIITVKTLEGNKTKHVTVNVIKEITSLDFINETLPVPRGEQLNLLEYLVFGPEDTNQKAVTYSLSFSNDAIGDINELNKVVILNDKILIPNDAVLSTFVLTAVSNHNNSLVASARIEVVNTLLTNDIKIFYNNNTFNTTDDDIELTKQGNNYYIELAKNVAALSNKNIYFMFGENGILDASFVATLSSNNVYNLLQVDALPDYEDTFELKSVGAEGQSSIEFVIKNASYPEFTTLHKSVVLKVAITSYPQKILLTTNTSSNEITTLDIYDNYTGENRYGTPLKITVLENENNNTSQMVGQNVFLSYNTQTSNLLVIKDVFGRIIGAGEKIVNGTTVYVSHNYSVSDIRPEDGFLNIIATSVSNPAVTSSVGINFIPGQISLAVSNANYKIARADRSNPDFVAGQTNVNFVGLPVGFDLNILLENTIIANPALVSVGVDNNLFTIYEKGIVGGTNIRVSVPNGSFVILNVEVFDVLSESNTKIKVAGLDLLSVSPSATLQDIKNLGYTRTLRSSLNVPIYFFVNGATTGAISVSSDITAFLVSRDIVNNIVTSDVTIVRASSDTYNSFSTQSRKGDALVTLTLRGYNELGQKNKDVVFKFVITVEVPIDSVQTNMSEVTIYNLNQLSLVQRPTYGYHTVTLNSYPTNAIFDYDDVEWVIGYNGSITLLSTEFSGTNNDIVTYKYSIGSVAHLVTLTTSVSNFKQATVSVNMSASTTLDVVFFVQAIVNQSYSNESGSNITSRKDTVVKVTGKNVTKVSDIVFQNVVNNTVTFDSRDLGFQDGEFTSPLKNRQISFDVLPANALTKDLGVSYEIGVGITVSVDNINRVINITANKPSTTGAAINVRVYALDSVNAIDGYTTYVVLKVEILDGNSEELAYKVSNVYDLARISEFMGAYYVLTNNINIQESAAHKDWRPIGYKNTVDGPMYDEFTGNFNGAYVVDGQTYYYTISGLRYKNSNIAFHYNYFGLFGVVGEKGVVKNVTLNDVYIDFIDNTFNTKHYVFIGAIAGLNKGTIENSIVNDGNGLNTLNSEKINTLTSTNLNYGIKFLSAAGDLEATRFTAIGGITGVNFGLVKNNNAYMLINANDSDNTVLYIGGLVGINYNLQEVNEVKIGKPQETKAKVTNTVQSDYVAISADYSVVSLVLNSSLGAIQNQQSAVGGAVGFNAGEVTNIVARSYAINLNYNNVGGLIGHNASTAWFESENAISKNSLVTHNLVVPTISGSQFVGGLVGFNEDAHYKLLYTKNANGYITNFSGLEYTINNNTSASEVNNNKVEFLDNNFRTSIHNTGIIAKNYAGGLIGKVVSRRGTDLNNVVLSNAYVNNSVYSYVTGKPVVNYYLNGTNNANNYAYFGDILLYAPNNDAYSTGANGEIYGRAVVGGLVGYAESGYFANSVFRGNIQGNAAVIGGLVGYVAGSFSELFLHNNSVDGTVYNRSYNLPVDIAGATASFIGDAYNLANNRVNFNVYASNLTTPYTYYKISNSISGIKFEDGLSVSAYANINTTDVLMPLTSKVNAVNSFVLSDNAQNTLTVNLAWTNYTYMSETVYHYATLQLPVTYDILYNGGTFDFNYTFTADGSHHATSAKVTINNLFDNNVEFHDFEAVPPSYTFADVSGYAFYSYAPLLSNTHYLNNADALDSGVLLNRNFADYIKHNETVNVLDVYIVTDDLNNNGINDIDEQNLNDYLLTTVFGVTIFDISGQASNVINSKIATIRNKTAEFLENILLDKEWYVNSSLNNGYPVLLSSYKYLLDIRVVNNTIVYDIQISLLSNWAPQDIIVEVNYDHNKVWDMTNVEHVTLYFAKIENYHFVNGQVDFGDKSSNALTTNFISEVKNYNTYKVEDLLDISTIPGFIGRGAYTLTSANDNVLSVEYSKGVQVLVAKQTGTAAITIKSNYNSALTKTIYVTVVNAISGNAGSYKIATTTNNVQTVFEKVHAINLVKSNNAATKSILLNALQDNLFKYNSATTGDVKFNMVKNVYSGTRYYLLNQSAGYNTIYHTSENPGDIVKFNNTDFVATNVGGGRYVYYMDFAYGSNAVLSSMLSGLSNTFLAVPYVVSYNNEKVVLANFNEEGYTNLIGQTTLQNGLSNGTVFTVNTINGTSGLTVTESAVSLDPISDTNFSVVITTDNIDEKLYLNYLNETDSSRTIRVDAFANNTTGFNIGKLNFLVNYYYDAQEGTKVYNFSVSVLDQNKIDKENDYQSIKQEFIRDLSFFTVFNNNDILFDSGTQTGFVTNNLNEIVEYSNFNRPLSVKLIPQEVRNISMYHYPNGEVKVTTDGSGNVVTNINLTEVAFNNIIPGYYGILKINIVPYFANFDYIDITSSLVNGSAISFEQMLAVYTKDIHSNMLFSGTYTNITSHRQVIANGIRLTKKSLVISNQNNLEEFDGYLYVRTLINTNTGSSNNFTITIAGYSVNGQTTTQTITPRTLQLKVETPPGLNLNYNGEKFAPLAIGTSAVFNTNLIGVTGLINFSESYVKDINGNKIGGYNSLFTINYINDTSYRITTSLTLVQGYELVVVGKISKEINGELYSYTDQLSFKLSNFVVTGIEVVNVTNGKFVGVFNQKHALLIRLITTYNPNIVGVQTAIKNLEIQLSTANFTWGYMANGEFGSLATGYNTARTYIITRSNLGVEYNNAANGFYLQNIVYNSSDILAVRVILDYGASGAYMLTGSTENAVYNKTFNEITFGFNFYRLSEEDSPEPIRTVEDLLDMQSGFDYILLNDLVLENWVPLSSNLHINSLDGNGYVITIKSFAAPLVTQQTSVNFGLFSEITASTTIKNLIIEIAPQNTVNISYENANTSETSAVDLDIQLREFSTVNFGILAGVNNGIVTNTQIVYDASLLKLERDLAIINSGIYHIDFESYYSAGVFNYNNFLASNINKYFPRKNMTAALGHSQGIYNYLLNTQTGLLNYELLSDTASLRRDLSIVRVLTYDTTSVHYMGGLVGRNSQTGFITNSSVENITINGVGYVAGLVALNEGKISSSYFKGANIINRSSNPSSAGTGGLVTINQNSAQIQYSYVFGRVGDGNRQFIYGVDGTGSNLYTPSTNTDKTGLSSATKQEYTGYEYNSYYGNANYEYNYRIGMLRAMNSAISTSSDIGAFVYRNNGYIANSYANILLRSTTSSAGFVFNNGATGEIIDVYTLSSIVQEQPRNHSPFTGVSSNDVYNNTGSITYSHYLNASGVISASINGAVAGYVDADYEDKYFPSGDNISISGRESATGINSGDFLEYNTFQGFAFNNDYSENQEIERSVWFIPNANELNYELDGSASVVKKYFKHNYYLQNTPELVSPNLKTISIRILTSDIDSSSANVYEYVPKYSPGESIYNPYLVRTAEEFNNIVLINNQDSQSGIDFDNIINQYNTVRLVRDITFNNIDARAKTYLLNFDGDLDGNGMTINQLRLVSNSAFEINGDSLTFELDNLGLFGTISSQKNSANDIISRGIVRNLNINVSEVRGTGVKYVGVLAGTITDAFVYNISINGNQVVQGKNVVGGLAGFVRGDSEIVNISLNGVGAKATYYKNTNPFSTAYYDLSVFENNNANTFELYYTTTDLATRLESIGNITSGNLRISYAGGVIGIAEVNEFIQNEDSTLRSAKLRRFTVNGSVSISAEVVGGIIGGLGNDSTANDLNFIISGNPRLIGSRVVGGLVGDLRGAIDRSTLRHSDSVQKTIDDAVKAALTNSTNYTFVTNSGLNYNDLFKGNPNYMGGLVGINYGGKVLNSYSKLNVVNLNAMYGGGVVGLGIGGSYSNVYTTGSVAAFKVQGGFIGINVQNNIVTTGYQFVNGLNGTDRINDIAYIDFANSRFENPAKVTALNGVNAMNIWRQNDLRLNRMVTYIGSAELVIGGLVGKVIATPNGNNRYSLSDVFSYEGILSISSRQNNELNHFNQVMLLNNTSNHSTLVLNNLVREIGIINNFDNDTNSDKETIVSNSTEPTSSLIENDIRFKGGVYYNYGVSDNYMFLNSNDMIISYHYSRLNNLSSARSLKEFVERRYVASQGSILGDNVAAHSVGQVVNYSDSNKTVAAVILPQVYYNWPSNYWKGTEISYNSEYETYELIDSSYVFPHIVPIADLSVVYVYTVNDLLKMNTYKRANFILMNDIDLITVPSWNPVGTNIDPFKGSITSGGVAVGGVIAPKTIKNLSIVGAPNSFIGLVGFATDSKFTNFNLEVLDINVTSTNITSEFYVGSLFAYGTDILVKDVKVSSSDTATDLASSYVIAMGGVGGVAKNSTAENVTVENLNIKMLSNAQSITDPSISGLFVGGAFGYMTASAKYAVSNVNVTDVKIDFLNLGHNIGATFNAKSINIGGAFGELSYDMLAVNSIVVSNVNVEHTSNATSNITAYVNFAHAGAIATPLENINIGGVIGKATSIEYVNKIVINDGFDKLASIQNSEIDSLNQVTNTNVFLRTNFYRNNVYIGSAVGSAYGLGNFNTIISNIEISASVINYSQANRISNGDIYIGGAIGYADAYILYNILTTSNITLSNTAVTTTISSSILSVGGVVGYASSSNGNTLLQFNGAINNTSSTNIVYGAQTNFGGLFGKINSAATTNSSYTNSTYGLSYSVNAGGINVYSRNNANIGGVAGYVQALSIDQSANVGDIFVNIYLTQTPAIGGLIGYVITDEGVAAGRVDINNSFAVGAISVQRTQSANLIIGGLVGSANVNSDDANHSFSITNSYSSVKIHQVNNNILIMQFYTTETKGGIVGSVTGSTGRETSPNVLLYNNYYNQDLVPYSNNIGTPLSTEQMLLDSNTSTNFTGFSFAGESRLWEVFNDSSSKSYPVLRWMLQNADFSNYAGVGTNLNPVIYTSGSINPAVAKAYIINSVLNTSGQNLNGVSLYFTQNGSIQGTGFNTIDAYTYLFKPTVLNADVYELVVNNYGYIYGYSGLGTTIRTNYGVIANSEFSFISTNAGLLDTVRSASPILEDNFVQVVVNAATGSIINSKVNATGGIIQNSYNIYYNNGEGLYKYSFYGYDGYLTPSFEYSEAINYYNYASNKFIMLKDWVMFNVTGLTPQDSQVLNNGILSLPWEFKDHWRQQDINLEYYAVSNGINYYNATGGVYLTNFDDFEIYVANLEANDPININSKNDLITIAYAASVGATTYYNKVLAPSADSFTNTEFAHSEDSVVKFIRNTQYFYGVKTVIDKKYMHFNGKTLSLNANINLSGELWTPIGFGYNDRNVTSVIASDPHNLFKGSINGNGYSISNMSSYVLDGNTGLFGAVYAKGAGTLEMATFAHNLTIANPTVTAYSSDLTYNETAGALVGKLFYENTGSVQNIIITLGVQAGIIVSDTYVGGIWGQMVKINTIYSNQVTISRSYVTSHVRSIMQSANGFGHNYNAENAGNSLINLSEVYFAGFLNSINYNGNYAFVNLHKHIVIIASGTVSSTNTSAYTTTLNYATGSTNIETITNNTLRTYNLNHFTWGGNLGWIRLYSQNGGMPIISTNVDYWINHNVTNAPEEVFNFYNIFNAEQLAWVSQQVAQGVTFAGKTITLQTNINLGSKLWTPIGYDSEHYFAGTFNGNGFEVRDLIVFGVYLYDDIEDKIVYHSGDNVGLFGYVRGYVDSVATGVTIENVIISNSNLSSGYASTISGGNYVGSAVGYVENANLNNLRNDGGVFGNTYVGGVVGRITTDESGTYSYANFNTNNSAVVYGTSYVGGLVGAMSKSISLADSVSLTNSANSATVNASTTGNFVGGVVGHNYYNLTNVRNSGNVTGGSYVGGVAGYTRDGIINGITNFEQFRYDNSGVIIGVTNVGGIAGYATSNSTIVAVRNSGNVRTSSSVSYSNANLGGIVGYGNSVSLFEVANSGDISQVQNIPLYNIGGIAGYYNTVSDIIRNVLQDGAINVNSSYNNGLLFGYLSSAPTQKTINMAVSNTLISTGSVVTNLIGSHIGDYVTIAKRNDISSSTFANAFISDNASYTENVTELMLFNNVNYKSVAWNYDGVLNKYTLTPTISGTKPSGEGTLVSPYIVDNEQKFIYLSRLIKQRFYDETYRYISITANFTNTGTMFSSGAFPFYGRINGGNNEITVNNLAYSTSGLIPYVIGKSTNKSIITSLNVKVSNSTTNSSYTYVGALVGKGIHVDVSSVNIVRTTIDDTFKGYSYVGAVAGLLSNSTLSNVTSNLSVVGTRDSIGGLVGYATASAINNSTVNILRKITGINRVGGIAGYVNNTSLYNNTTNLQVENVGGQDRGSFILANGEYAGGIVGYAEGSTTSITYNDVLAQTAYSHYTTSYILSSGSDLEAFPEIPVGKAGALAGYVNQVNMAYNYATTLRVITDNYGFTGGLVGYSSNSTISNNTLAASSIEKFSMENIDTWRSRTFEQWGLTSADWVITQTNSQTNGLTSLVYSSDLYIGMVSGYDIGSTYTGNSFSYTNIMLTIQEYRMTRFYKVGNVLLVVWRLDYEMSRDVYSNFTNLVGNSLAVMKESSTLTTTTTARIEYETHVGVDPGAHYRGETLSTKPSFS